MLRSMQRSAGLFLVVLLGAALFSCDRGTVQSVDLRKKEQVGKRLDGKEINGAVRFAVGGMITPKEGFIYYKEFMDYVGKKLGRRVLFVDREKYDEINALLRTGEVDVAFVCSGPYVDGHDQFGLELLAAPQAYGAPVYYSYIIVHRDSPIADFEGLRGKSFAFADPLSNSGKLVPDYMLARMGETPDSYFSKYVYTYGHDKSIKAVAQKVVDGAAVDSLIWEFANRTDPEFTSQTKIIKKSPPYAIPPVVVRKELDAGLKKDLRRILLEAHEDPEGRAILARMLTDRFVAIDDAAYDSVREMKRRVAGRRTPAGRSGR